MRKKIEPLVDDEETETQLEELHEQEHDLLSDEDDDELDHWYLLLLFLEKDSYGRLKEPYKIVEGAPDWCPSMLEKWKEKRKKGFKVP